MGLEGIVSKRMDAPYRSGPSRTWLKLKNPASEAVRRARGGVALVSAHPGLHGSAQMENPTKASTAKLRTIIAIAATSMLKARLGSNAMRHRWRQSSGGVDLDHTAFGSLKRFPGGVGAIGAHLR
jgi:hypothetical protein